MLNPLLAGAGCSYAYEEFSSEQLEQESTETEEIEAAGNERMNYDIFEKFPTRRPATDDGTWGSTRRSRTAVIRWWFVSDSSSGE